MKTLSIQLKDKQYELLTRTANAERRKLPDFLYVLLGEGLSSQFRDHGVSILKTDSEFTEEEKEAFANNKVLEKTKGWESLNHKEREEKGWTYVCRYLNNCGCGGEADYIEILSDSILHLVITDNPTEEYP